MATWRRSGPSSGAATLINNATGINVDTVNDEVSVCSEGNAAILTFPRTANGNVAPIRNITGAATGINSPFDTSLDTVNNEIYLANFGGQTVTVYPRTGDGNVAPIRTITNAGAITAAMVLSTATVQSYCCVTPYNIWFRPCTNTSAATPPVPTSDLPCFLYCIDRERSGWLSVFRYPATTGFGTSNPWLATAFAVDDFVMFGGGDGNVYFQTVRTLNQGNMLATRTNPVFTAR